jgi:hypothetical protein
MLRGLEVGRELIAAAGTEVTSIKIIGGAAANLGVDSPQTQTPNCVLAPFSFPCVIQYSG